MSEMCIHISGDNRVWYACNVLYIHVNCLAVRGCAVSRRYINVCNSDVLVLLYVP